MKLVQGATTINASNLSSSGGSTSRTARFNLSGAPTGLYDISLTQANGSYTKTGAFTVYAPPTVTGIAPLSGFNLGTIAITNLAGTNFRTGDTVQLTKSGQSAIPGTNVVVVSATQITCSFDLTGVATGAWNVVVTDPSNQTATLTNGFTVNATPSPAPTSITPSTGTSGSTVNITNLAGSNFFTGDTVKLSKTGQTDIAATSVVVASGTQITCSFAIPSGTALGAWDVVVTDTLGHSGSIAGGFTVTAPNAPTVTSVSPTTGNNVIGSAVALTVNGTGFLSGDTVALKKGATTINATSVVISSAIKITCTVNVVGAPVGAYDVVVTDVYSQSGTLPGGFTVFAPTPPVLTSITPSYEDNAPVVSMVSVKIYGTGFLGSQGYKAGNPKVVFHCNDTSKGQPDYVFSGSNWLQTTPANAQYVMASPYFFYGGPSNGPAVPGPYTVTVTNSDGGAASIPFTVVDSAAYVNPVPLTIAPNSVPNTGVAHVAITGTGFFVPPAPGGALNTVQLRNSAGSGDVIYATNVNVTDTQHLTCDIDVTGKGYGVNNPWDVQVCAPNDFNPSNQPGQYMPITGGGTLAAAFTVTSSTPFTVTSVSPNYGSTQSITGLSITGTGFLGVVGSNNPNLILQLVQHGGTAVIPTNGGAYYVSSTSVTAGFMTTNAGLPLGLYDLHFQNSDGATLVVPSCFTLYASPTPVLFPPSPTTTAPNTGPTVTLTFMATGLVTGSVPHLTMAGQPDIVGENVVVNLLNSETIACTFQLWGVKAGTWNCIVVQPDGNWGGRQGNVFTVTEVAPTLTSITPNSGLNTGPVSTTLVGTNLAPQDTVKLQMSGQPDILGSTLTSVTHTQAGCTFDLTGAAPGKWDVVLTDLSGSTATLPAGFTIANPAPTVTSITPNSGVDTGPVSITNLAGTGFLPGATVKLSKTGQPDINATGVTVVSPTKITCTFNLAGAALGAWDVTVTNTDTQFATLPGGFTVGTYAPVMAALPTYTIGTSRSVSWSNVDPQATQCQVQCSTDQTFATVTQDSGWMPVTTTYTFSGLTEGTKYYYQVRVGNGAQISPWSNIVFSTQRDAQPILTYTGDTTTAYGNPTALSATLMSSGTPVQGVRVGFVIGTFAASGTTDANGVATATIPANGLYGGLYTIYCTSDATNGYLEAHATAPLNITMSAPPDTYWVDGSGLFTKVVSCSIKFHFGGPSGTGYLTYVDSSTRKTISATGATSIVIGPGKSTATISGNCTVNGAATTFTLVVTPATGAFTMSAASGYPAYSGVLKSGSFSITP